MLWIYAWRLSGTQHENSTVSVVSTWTHVCCVPLCIDALKRKGCVGPEICVEPCGAYDLSEMSVSWLQWGFTAIQPRSIRVVRVCSNASTWGVFGFTKHKQSCLGVGNCLVLPNTTRYRQEWFGSVNIHSLTASFANTWSLYPFWMSQFPIEHTISRCLFCIRVPRPVNIFNITSTPPSFSHSISRIFTK